MTAAVQERASLGGPKVAQARPAIRREVGDDGICVLTFDRPDSSANIFDRDTLNELSGHLDFIASDRQLKGAVLFSAKKAIFIAGADLKTFMEMKKLEDARALIELGQSVFNCLASLPIPTVAAIHGACVGGGFEMSLACDFRIASTERATKIGLPETQLGLIPAWGGSTRLPRLIGLPKALDVILAGRTLAAKQALKYGMVDEVVPREYLLQAARKKVAKGKPRRESHFLTNNALAAALIRSYSRPQVLKKTRGHYPAVLKALEVVTNGITRSVGDSLKLEADAILELAQTESTRNLIRIFFLQERAKKLKVEQASTLSTAETGKVTVPRCAVIGAGVMGAGIAQWLSARGLTVILRDIKPEFVARGMANIARLYDEGVKRHIFTRTEARGGLDRISPAAQDVPLKQVDLVIEAAVETMELKKDIFRRLDEQVRFDAVLATNTSALSVSELAAAIRLPERVVGLHFFNPVHRMQLVEVIQGRQTSPETLHRAVRFAQQIGKLPVLVKDSPGFLVNRILMPYLIEAGNLFEAGAGADDLDEAMRDFGMPMRPLRLLDEVGLDVGHHVAETLAAKFSSRMRLPEVLGKMIKAGLMGKKSGRGFYIYPPGKKSPHLNAQTDEFRRGVEARGLTREGLRERMVLLMVDEAARCLEEQIVSSPADVDFAMIMGTGFAPFRGGPLRHADAEGAARIVERMNGWVARGAGHFQPCELLQRMPTDGKTFYSDTNGAK